MENEQNISENTLEIKKDKNTINLPAAIITSAVIIAISILIAFNSKNNLPEKNVADQKERNIPSRVDPMIVTLQQNDHIRGDTSKAEIALFEYSDSDCPFCIKFHNTVKTLLSEYKDNLVWIYRYFPLSQLHPNAYSEAIAMECAYQIGGDAAFDKYLDTVIDVTLNNDSKVEDTLISFATTQGLDKNLFKTCMLNPDTAKLVDSNISEAKQIGAQGTPFSILVNLKTGKQIIIPGAYPIEEIRKNIDSLL